ncbi:glutaminase [Promicromonospora sp. NPDC050262]|uniref:glutaminase n=1 Tax=Promicromonospora sp. NPDC050262 TaxID=3155036 RepID=UPI0033F357ED
MASLCSTVPFCRSGRSEVWQPDLPDGTDHGGDLMRSPILDYLDTIIEQTAHIDSGALADYVPELAAADPDWVAVALCTVNGTVYASGDTDHEFSIQSMSKPFAYSQAIEDRGLKTVLKHIGVEPSGEAFNELSLDLQTGKPRNPMINAGAITTHALLNDDEEPAVDRMLGLFSRLAERRSRWTRRSPLRSWPPGIVTWVSPTCCTPRARCTRSPHGGHRLHPAVCGVGHRA